MDKCPLDKMDQAIAEILDEYGDEVVGNLAEITQRVAKEGAKTAKAEAKGKFGGTGKYAKGWTSTVETGRLSTQGTIYNKDLPGLPHLLEYGHANRGGGRTPGKPHLKAVEQRVIKQFERLVTDTL